MIKRFCFALVLVLSIFSVSAFASEISKDQIYMGFNEEDLYVEEEAEEFLNYVISENKSVFNTDEINFTSEIISYDLKNIKKVYPVSCENLRVLGYDDIDNIIISDRLYFFDIPCVTVEGNDSIVSVNSNMSGANALRQNLYIMTNEQIREIVSKNLKENEFVEDIKYLYNGIQCPFDVAVIKTSDNREFIIPYSNIGENYGLNVGKVYNTNQFVDIIKKGLKDNIKCDDEKKEEIIKSIIETVQNNTEYFGGYYFIGDMEEIHLFAYNREEAKEIIKKSVGENYEDYIYVKLHEGNFLHTSHLINAIEYIDKHREDFELVGYGKTYKSGAEYLYIDGFDMTEEKKNYIKYVTDFNYIDFGSFDRETYITYNDSTIEEIDEGSSHKTTYFMDIETGKITLPQDSSFEYNSNSKPYYDENGVLMIPVNGILDLSGAELSFDNIFKMLTAKFDGGSIKISENYIEAGDVKRNLVTPAVFENDICYISINDAISFVTYDKTVNILYWDEENSFQNIKSNIEEMGEYIYSFKIGNSSFLFNNKEISIDTPIYNKDGYLMIPVRALFDAADDVAQISWNESTKKAYVNACGMEIEFMPETNKLFVNKKEMDMVGSIDIKNGRIFVPLRMLQAIGISSEYDFYWDSSSNTAILRI